MEIERKSDGQRGNVPMGGKKKSKFETERRFHRVRALLTLRVTPISIDELSRVERVGATRSPITGARLAIGEALSRSEDLSAETRRLIEKAFEFLISVDQKVTVVLDMLSGRSLGGALLERVAVDISGGGIQFDLSESQVELFQIKPIVDGALQLDLYLPTLPLNVITCYAKIRRLTIADNGISVGAEYVAISEDDRQEIVRFVVQRERETLRLGRGRPVS